MQSCMFRGEQKGCQGGHDDSLAVEKVAVVFRFGFESVAERLPGVSAIVHQIFRRANIFLKNLSTHRLVWCWSIHRSFIRLIIEVYRVVTGRFVSSCAKKEVLPPILGFEALHGGSGASPVRAQLGSLEKAKAPEPVGSSASRSRGRVWSWRLGGRETEVNRVCSRSSAGDAQRRFIKRCSRAWSSAQSASQKSLRARSGSFFSNTNSQ